MVKRKQHNMEMSNQEKAAYMMGYYDYLDGLKIENNPYDQDKNQETKTRYEAWDRGYKKAIDDDNGTIQL